MTPVSKTSFSTDLKLIKKLVKKGGPEPHEYKLINQWLVDLELKLQSGVYTEKELDAIRKAFGESLSTKTMHGRAYRKRFGYPGDFEIIDLTYQYHLSDDPKLRKWDEYTHQRGFLRALRNRKTYFKELLAEATARNPDGLWVLNVASGPCRDVAEFLEAHPESRVRIDCLEFDPRAIQYARGLLGRREQVRFINQNIFKFQTDERYDLIWSAGLFDYFDDQTFLNILGRMLSWTNPGGEVIIGNFTRNCPASVGHFRLVDWPLFYRGEAHLIRLAGEAGMDAQAIKVEAEPLGINLFLRLIKTGVYA